MTKLSQLGEFGAGGCGQCKSMGHSKDKLSAGWEIYLVCDTVNKAVTLIEAVAGKGKFRRRLKLATAQDIEAKLRSFFLQQVL